MTEGGLSYETLRAIVEHASDGVFVTDGTLRIEWVNASACAMLGRTTDELIGHRVSEWIDPDELAREPIKREELLAGKTVITTRTFHTGDGGVRILEVSAKLVSDGRILGLARDVTERLHAQHQLALSEASFRALIDRSPDAIVVHRHGRIWYANDACAHLLGWPRPSWGIGRPAIELAHPDHRAHVAARMSDLLAGAEVAPFAEERLVRADGSEVVAMVGAMHVVFEGEPSIVVLARDTSELRRMSEQLAQADRLASLGTLAAGVAHEINNPLTYVLLHLDAISGVAGEVGGRERERLLESVESAMDGVRRVARIVRDLRAFSRVEDDDVAIIDVRRPIETALSAASHELKHRARVERRFGDVPRVLASEGRLAQIVLNLLLNAAYAIPEGNPDDHRVTVTTTSEGDELRLSITDTGVGIPEEHRHRVFEPFFTTRKVGEGSGLGLSICHGLVSALGGRIELESEVGRGTTFTVVLPTSSARALTPRPPPVAEKARRRRRILFVDDEENIGLAVSRAFGAHDEVVLATSGYAARDRLQTDRAFDVVVCDLAMPGMTGTQLYEWIGAHAPELARRVLFVTGGRLPLEGLSSNATSTGHTLDKPFTLDALDRAIDGVIADAP